MSNQILKRSLVQVISKIQNSLLWEMINESGTIYSAALDAYNKNFSFEQIQKLKPGFTKRKFLHSQSYRYSYCQAIDSIKSYFAALKSFKKNPEKFKEKPGFPKAKKIFCISFMQDMVRVKGEHLLLSSGQRDNPIKIRWSLEKPIFATISLKHGQWRLVTVFNKEQKQEKLGEKTLAIDLGIKRLAATFDGKNTTLFAGKPLLSINRYFIKQFGKLQSLKNNQSRRAKRKKFAIKRSLQKAGNIKKDILHKYSRKLVNLAIKSGCGTISFGDCASIHDAPDKGKETNQKISFNPDQYFRKLVSYKFEEIGGATKIVPEYYSSQTCPVCGLRHKPNNRTFACKCGFTYDRDSVGAINIHVSSGGKKLTAKRSRSLIEPLGVKYHPMLNCSLLT